jgi:hypothetical protein
MSLDVAPIMPPGPVGRSERDAVQPDRGGVKRSEPPGEEVAGVIADIVDEWGRQSFPASDPPSNW